MSTVVLSVVVFVAQITVVIRALLRPHRDPASRIAWVVVIVALPAIGIFIYLLLGEVNIGRKRTEKMRQVLDALPPLPRAAPGSEAILAARVPAPHEHLFKVGLSVNGFEPVGGNRALLLNDANAAIDAIVDDIEAARDHVHLLFYIWLPDRNGRKVAAALQRAAARGVACRVMVDDVGSRLMIQSDCWQDLTTAGVRAAVALPVGNPLLRPLLGRIDLRNHRKIVVIDNRITYCGSQNCADPEFRIKSKFAPWVDLQLRVEGPVARQNQYVFASDWTAHTDEPLDHLLAAPIDVGESGFTAQVVATGPTVRYSAMPEMFESLLFAARREVVITTPYYVPDDSLQAAICAAGHRGIETTMIVPKRNDSRVVAAASRSYYPGLLAAGVRIFEYTEGLLHTKSLTIDGEAALIGSANMDRRSFELNFENNLLIADTELTDRIRAQQQKYLDDSERVLRRDVERWSALRRLQNNAVGTLGPIL